MEHIKLFIVIVLSMLRMLRSFKKSLNEERNMEDGFLVVCFSNPTPAAQIFYVRCDGKMVM
jgi:hypothetical protein